MFPIKHNDFPMTLKRAAKAASAVLLLAASAFSLKAAKNKQEFDAVVISVDDSHREVETHRTYATGQTTYNGYSSASTNYTGYGTAQTSVNTYGTATTNRTTHQINGTQDIVGHRLMLQLPDGRVITVACSGKYAPRGDYVNQRSCRVPLTSNIHVDVWKDNAKLYWNTSIDNSKTESETYKIIGVLPASQLPAGAPAQR